MQAFGRREGGGRRDTDRLALRLSAAVRTLFGSGLLEVEDVSASGARLRGPRVPKAGEELMVRIENVEAFARVIWSGNGVCGVAFEDHLSASDLARLQQEARTASLMRLSPHEKIAMNHWGATRLG